MQRLFKVIRYLCILSSIITLPIVLVGNYWLINTVKNFYDFKVRYDISPHATSLLSIGRGEYAHIRRSIELGLLSRNLPVEGEENSSLETMSLFVLQSDLNKLNANLPHSGFSYVDGTLINEGRSEGVDMRYRGDFSPHWRFPKKSYRIKTSKANLYMGIRKFNLISNKMPSQLANYTGYLLAGYLGNLAPEARMVKLMINNDYRGTFTFVEQVNESMLRRAGFMPGDIFSGELLAKDEFVGIEADLFRQQGMWDKVAVNNHYENDAAQSMTALIGLLSSPMTEEAQLKLLRLMDVEHWGRFLAFETIGQTYHFDASHNWRIYFDPATSKFVPIVWDPMAWTFGTGALSEADVAPTLIQKVLLQNAAFLAARSRHIINFYRERNDAQYILSMDEMIAEMSGAIVNDPDLRPYSTEKTKSSMGAYRREVSRTINQIKHIYDPLKCTQKYARVSTKVIRLEISGRCEIKNLQLVLSQAPIRPMQMTLRYERIGGESVEFDITDRVGLTAGVLEFDLSLMAEYRPTVPNSRSAPNEVLRVLPATYDLVIEDLTDDNKLDHFSVDVHGVRKQVQLVPRLSTRRTSVKAIIDPGFSNDPILWSSDQYLSGVTEINQPLIIKAGVTVYLDEGASLIVRGKVTAMGTQYQLIRFLKKPGQKSPWGTLALLSELANGSTFDYVEFADGSGLKKPLFEYSGMLSIHGVKNVRLNKVKFEDNSDVDDMLHLVYADVEITNSIFRNAYKDALDSDLSKLKVSSTNFYGSGDDAIDLMGGEAWITSTNIYESRDKGISVGEASRLKLTDSLLELNNIGIQIKDGSQVEAKEITFVDNQLAVDASKKNWRYNDGGHITLTNSQFLNNIEDMQSDNRSTISVSGGR